MLKERVALITGASRGIGEATARYFAERATNLVLLSRSEKPLNALAASMRNSNASVLTFTGDVSRFADVEAACQAAIEAFGGIDILVNNAGTIDPIARIENSDPEAWGRVIDTNLKGVYHGLRAVIPHMLTRGSGIVVNISSGAATSALEGWSHYCASKAGVLSLTKCAHKEFAERGIRVVGLSPGTVISDMQDSIRESGINPVSQLDPSAHIPADWVARAIGFLCTDAASDFDGGDFTLKTDEGRQLAGLPPIN